MSKEGKKKKAGGGSSSTSMLNGVGASSMTLGGMRFGGMVPEDKRPDYAKLIQQDPRMAQMFSLLGT